MLVDWVHHINLDLFWITESNLQALWKGNFQGSSMNIKACHGALLLKFLLFFLLNWWKSRKLPMVLWSNLTEHRVLESHSLNIPNHRLWIIPDSSAPVLPNFCVCTQVCVFAWNDLSLSSEPAFPLRTTSEKSFFQPFHGLYTINSPSSSSWKIIIYELTHK